MARAETSSSFRPGEAGETCGVTLGAGGEFSEKMVRALRAFCGRRRCREDFETPIDLVGVRIDDLDGGKLPRQFESDDRFPATGLAGEVERRVGVIHRERKTPERSGTVPASEKLSMPSAGSAVLAGAPGHGRLLTGFVIGTVAAGTAHNEFPAHEVLVVQDTHGALRFVD